MPAWHRAEIRKQTRLFSDYFNIDEVIACHERPDGSMSKPERRLVFERGDAAAVLLVNLDTESVVLVHQFRVPVLIGRRREDAATIDGWLTEAVAGAVEPNESPSTTAIRETMEETGYRIRAPKLIGKFFSSPGGGSERIFLYYCEVRDADRLGEGGGLEDEDVKIVQMPLNDLFERLANGLIEDPKLAIGGYWLKDHIKHK